MDPSALESVSRSLESSLDSWGAMLLMATLLVVIGLILEYWHEIKDFWAHVRWPMAAFPWDKLVAISGGILVTLGVAGELLFTYKASRVETDLRENNHRIEALLNKEAGDAWNAAESAKATAKGFESQIAGADARAKEAEAQVASAEAASRDAVAKVAEATARAAEANQKAEAEKVERLKLEAIVAPRSLSLDQQRQITAALRKFSGHPAVSVSSYGLDGEAMAFGAQLISIIASATGVTPLDFRTQVIVAGGFEWGIHIRGPASENEFMSTLASALRTIGKLDVWINGPAVVPGGAMQNMAAENMTFSGGATTVVTKVPTSGPVSIFVGIKPVPVLLRK